MYFFKDLIITSFMNVCRLTKKMAVGCFLVTQAATNLFYFVLQKKNTCS